jgi:A/G-specific adenine glycosylase
MLLIEHAGSLLLEKRSTPGIWGGLWCFPEVGVGDDVESACAHRFGARVDAVQRMPDVKHGFTHFSLTISPQRVKVGTLEARAAEPGYQWLEIGKLKDAALPAPVKRIVDALNAA